ncbi:MAG: hypothetical protein OXT65_12725 [Alphaproteobacteria bacterium]|nr:hypothetical protein [Alphaproteobacteria bacterium]
MKKLDTDEIATAFKDAVQKSGRAQHTREMLDLLQNTVSTLQKSGAEISVDIYWGGSQQAFNMFPKDASLTFSGTISFGAKKHLIAYGCPTEQKDNYMFAVSRFCIDRHVAGEQFRLFYSIPPKTRMLL